MSDVAIRAEGLGKRYRIGAVKERYHTLRDAVVNAAKVPFRLASRLARGGGANEHIWALKDVSFEVKRGEVVGVIGRNGAGKTTLLKVLSRITEPTEGRAEILGRVGSLLEVGTGFHPELTGRENMFLNGAILGMKRREIGAKFDEIVSFAEVEKFIDTPVKRYSSGMQVRLAFAVAAHLEPEILLVDEVLAVGDAAFQKKCLGKMGEVAGEGRTVVFVSHNMGVVSDLCPRAILLSDGCLREDGQAARVTRRYLSSFSDAQGTSYVCSDPPNVAAWIAAARLKSEAGQERGSFLMTEPLVVECEVQIDGDVRPALSVQIKEMNNSPIFHFPCVDEEFDIPTSAKRHCIRTRIPPLNLYPGEYMVRLKLTDRAGTHYDTLHLVDGIRLEIRQDYSAISRPLGREVGVIFARAQWSSTSGSAREVAD